MVAILTPPDGKKVTDPAWQKKVVGELNDVVDSHKDQVVSWVGWLRAPDTTAPTVQQMKTEDGSKTFISIPLKGDDDDTILKNYQTIEPDLEQVNGGNIQLAGLNPLASELTGTIGEDQKRAEVAAIPLVCVVLFFVFGGVVRRRAAGHHRRPDDRRRAGHHAVDRRIHAGALLRPAGGDADGARHRGRLRVVHGQPVPRRDRGGLRHRDRGQTRGDDVRPDDHVLGRHPGGVVGAAAAVPAAS